MEEKQIAPIGSFCLNEACEEYQADRIDSPRYMMREENAHQPSPKQPCPSTNRERNHQRQRRPEEERATDKDLLTKDIRDCLKDITTPTLLIWGEYDSLVPPMLGDILNQERRPAHLLILKKAGYVSMFDQPKQFHAAVLTYVGGHNRLFTHATRDANVTHYGMRQRLY